MVKIFIDPGHGGMDSGAVGNGLYEKNVTLQIARRINEILLNEYSGVTTRLSRTGDQTVSLSQRTNAANAWGADFYLSVHINSGGGTGYEDFIYPGSGTPTTTYQTNIHQEVMKLVDFVDRGRKQANFHVLRVSNMPALLTENGFIDNSSDAAKLKQTDFIDRIARGHVNGLVRSFNLQKKLSGGGAYRLKTGTFANETHQRIAAERLRSFSGWIVHEVSDNGLRLLTGSFRTRAHAEIAKRRVVNEFGWVVHIVEDN